MSIEYCAFETLGEEVNGTVSGLTKVTSLKLIKKNFKPTSMISKKKNALSWMTRMEHS